MGIVVLGVLTLAGIVLYALRGLIGAQLATAYLRSRGVTSAIVVERLDPGGFTGSAVLGDPKDPDLTVRRAEVEFEAIPLFKGGFAAPRLRSVRLIEPRLKARWDGKAFNFGSLQGLVDGAARAPGTGPGPSVVVERGQARIATPAGPLIIDGDGRLDSGRLVRLAARLRPAALRQGDLTVAVAGASLQAASRGDSIAATVHLDVTRLARAGAVLEGLKGDLVAQIPYDRSPRFDGRYSLDAKLEAAAVTTGPQMLSRPRLSLALAGTTAGPVDRLAFKGSGVGALTADGWTAAAARIQRVDLAGRIVGLDLSRTPQQTRFALDADLNGTASRIAAAGLDTGPARIAARLATIRGVVDATGGALTLVPDVALSAPKSAGAGLTARGATIQLASSRAAATWKSAGWSLSGPLQTHAVLDWKKAGWSLSGPLQVRAVSSSVALPILTGDLTLRDFNLNLSGPAALSPAGPVVDLAGSAKSGGGALSPVAAQAFADTLPMIGTDPSGRAAILAAFRTARLDAPAFAIRSGGESLRLLLPRPLRLTGAAGAGASVAALGAKPFATATASGIQGGLAVHLGGARLPELDLQVPAYRAELDRGGPTLQADVKLAAAFDGDSLHDLKLSAPVRLARASGVLTAVLQECGPVRLAAFGPGPMPLLVDVSAAACPEPARPVLTLGPSGWRFDAGVQDVQADAPAGETRIRAGRGSVQMSATGGASPVGVAEVGAARILDGAAMKRFEPLALTGRLELDDDVWRGPLQVAEAGKGRPVALVQVAHTMATATGGADIAAPALTFAKDGLQPGDLSPLAAVLASNAEGTISFTGRADWSPSGGVVSRGRLTTQGVDFKSQFGLVKAATADLTFTSLAPLVTAPHQTVAADSVGWLIPLTKAKAAIALREDRIAIDRAQADAAGGQVVLDPLDLLYTPGAPMSGTVRLVQIDLGALIKQFNLADKVAIDARIDGTVPFAFTNGALRLDKGHVYATGPGRLSIKREALTGAVAAAATPPNDAPGAPPAPAPAAPGGVQDIAYQALENLAFDKLEADLVSQPMGRLGILFKINGRNDPPSGGKSRISVFDLLRGKALDNFTLPKGTPVNLTLDTSLNFDELLAAYNERGRSESVQPGPAKK